MTTEQIIIGCRRNDLDSQRELFNKYAPIMRGVVLRYVNDIDEVKDILQESFIKVFKKFNTYSGKGSFEGWIKRIVINTTLNCLKRNRRHRYQENIDYINEAQINIETDSIEIQEKPVMAEMENDIMKVVESACFSIDEILNLLNELPYDLRAVFNMFYIDNYKHKEIGKTLKINESTSRTRLMKARKIMQRKLYELSIKKHQKVVF